MKGLQTMKKFLLGLSFVFALGFCNVVQADKVAGTNLGAQSIKDAFNAMNNGYGYFFTEAPPPREDDFNNAYGVTIVYRSGGDQTDLSAYKDNIWQTFCCQPEVRVNLLASFYSGKLSYDSNTTSNTASGEHQSHNLTVGAAYLYSQYVLGNLNQFNDVAVGDAIRYLMGYRSDNGGGIGDPLLGLEINGWTNTENNKVLYYLSTINSESYWTTNYDPNSYYTEIGNYSVFVLNVLGQPGNLYTQDFLYLANAANPYTEDAGGGNGTPEPATLLLWTLGGLGLAGTSWTRKRRMMKSA